MAGISPKSGRLKRYARRAAFGVGGFLGVVVVLVFGLLFALRFAGVRNFVVGKVNGALADSFKGKIKLLRLQSIGLDGIGAADAEIFDPSGRRVIDVHGLDVRLRNRMTKLNPKRSRCSQRAEQRDTYVGREELVQTLGDFILVSALPLFYSGFQ